MAQCKERPSLHRIVINKIRHGLICNYNCKYLVRNNKDLIMVQGPHEFIKINDDDDSWTFEKKINWSNSRAVYVISYPKPKKKFLGIKQLVKESNIQIVPGIKEKYVQIVPGIEDFPLRFNVELIVADVKYLKVRVGLDVSYLNKGLNKNYNYLYWMYSADTNSLEYAPLTTKDDKRFIWTFVWLD